MPVELSSSSEDEELERDMRQLHREILPEERRTAQRPQHHSGPAPQSSFGIPSNTVIFRQEVIEVRAGMWYHTRDASYKHLLRRPPPPSAQLYDPIKRTNVLASLADVRRFYLYIADRQPEAAGVSSSESHLEGQGNWNRAYPQASLQMQRKTRLDLKRGTLDGFVPQLAYESAAANEVQYTQGEFFKLTYPIRMAHSASFRPDSFCLVKRDLVSGTTSFTFPHKTDAETDSPPQMDESSSPSSPTDSLLQTTFRDHQSRVQKNVWSTSPHIRSLRAGRVGVLHNDCVIVIEANDPDPSSTAVYYVSLPPRVVGTPLSFVGFCSVPPLFDDDAEPPDREGNEIDCVVGVRVAVVEERGIYEGVFWDRKLPLCLRVGFPRQRQVQCATYLPPAGHHQLEQPNLLIGFANGDLMLHDPRHATRPAGALSRPGMFAEWKGAFGGRRGAVQSLQPISPWSCLAAISDGSVHIIDIRRLSSDGYHVETVALYAPPVPLFSTRKIDATGDGRLCAFGTSEGKVRVMDLRTLQTRCDLDWPLARSDGTDAIGQPLFETVMIHRQLTQRRPDAAVERQLCLSVNGATGSRNGCVETLYCGEW